MENVNKRSNGVYQVDVKVPGTLRELLGVSNLRCSLGSRTLDVATRRQADPQASPHLCNCSASVTIASRNLRARPSFPTHAAAGRVVPSAAPTRVLPLSRRT